MALVTGAAVLGVIILAAYLLFMLIPRGGPTASAVVPTQPGAVAWDDSSPTTVLLARTGGTQSPVTAFLVFSYAPSGHRLNILSIPANLWLTVPGFGQATLGQAYADGGIHLLLVTAQSALGLPIPYYAVADSGTMARIIDAFGGTSVTRDNFLSLIRVTQSSDNLIRLPSVLDSLGSDVATNFPLNRVPDLLGELSATSPDRTIEANLGPISGTTTPYSADGMQVLLPRWDRLRALARRLLAPPAPAGSVVVLNGGGVPGQAAALAAWLRSTAIPVGRYATAPASDYLRTEVMLRPGSDAANQALGRTVAGLLQVPLVTGSVPNHGARLAVIIGRDFQSPAQQ
jgi:hypothetical protein